MTRALKVHGQVAAGAFYGYSPLVVRVADSGSGFTADSAANATTGAFTEGGYSKAVKAMQSLGSIVLLGAQGDAAFCAIVDGPSFNDGRGAITAGAFGALKDAMVLAGVTATVGNLSVTSGTSMAISGAFTLA